MTVRKLTVSFGAANALGRISHARDLAWDEFAALLTQTPPESEDKTSAGWFIPATFEPLYRDSANFKCRDALTLDYDCIKPEDVVTIQAALKGYAYAIYTTASHTKEAPRIRIVMPTMRAMSADEFCAVSRKVAGWAGIELAARESHTPAQMSFLPTRKPGAEFKGKAMKGAWLDVDSVLAMYDDWTDQSQWPKRVDHDSTYRAEELPTPAREKAGVIGEFNRAFTITQAIERFQLPYSYVSDTRWNYTNGSRGEGMRTYDDDSKAHNENDTNPARGQHSAFDLVRLHKFHGLDKDVDADIAITERPSFQAMVRFALEQPEVLAAQLAADFEPLPPVDTRECDVGVPTGDTGATGTPGQRNDVQGSKDLLGSAGSAGLARKVSEAIKNRTAPRWLIKDCLERGVIAILAGRRGSYKSFLALDWAMKCALAGNPVYVISAEGGDFDRRAKAWLIEHEHVGEVENVPLYVAERRMDLSTKEAIDKIRDDCKFHGIRPVLFALDTVSKLSGSLDENDNSRIKAWIGLLDNGLKRAYDATVLLVAHTGHSDQGRPRGASALGADTDAEYIMERDPQDGSVSVSRQRFKSSPELPPLYFRPEVVELDYTDDEGQPITSLVLLPTDPPAGEMSRRGAPKKNPGKLLSVAREMLAEADTVVVSSLLDKFVETLPHDSGVRDRRRRTAQRALDSLVNDKFLVLRDSDTIALTRAEKTDAGAFDA